MTRKIQYILFVTITLFVIFLVASPITRELSVFEYAISDIEELEGVYRLTDVKNVQIQSDGEDVYFQVGGGDREKIVSTGSHNWKVPELDIGFYGRGHNERPKLFIERYGETVSLSPAEHTLSGNNEDTSVTCIVEHMTPRLMIAWNVPGVSVAVVQNNNLSWLGQYGIKRYKQTEPVGSETVFEAASMSKPVFAYVVLQLVEEGMMDLDTPLVEYLGESYTEGALRHKKITARMVLSHTSGFPNWRDGGWGRGGPIPVLFEPGTDYKYSGEGILFLQRAVEKLAGIPAEELMKKRLLEPLNMTNSSYIWQVSYDSLAAGGHNRLGRIKQQKRSIYRRANMAYTLYTTPADYAKFLIEMMNEDRSAPHSISSALLNEMLTVQSDVPDREPMLRRGGEPTGTVHFGLGWRIEALETGNRYCHGGSNGTGFRCHSEFNPETGNGIIIMTNGVGGAGLRTDLIRYAGEN